jgi:hypothetical protein
MSYGEMIAMADLFESFDQMKTADPKQIQELVKLIQKDVAKPGSVTTAEWQAATKGRYVDLAEQNTAHFAPSDPALLPESGAAAGQDHKRLWEQHHSAALALAQQGKRQEALALNAYGDHYLTDAFAAGHLFNKPDVMRLFRDWLGEGTAFFNAVARIAWADPTVELLLSRHETVDGGWDIDSADRFSLLLQGIYEEVPDRLAGLVAKLVHDRLNTIPNGVEVENKLGMKWKLAGDKTLDSSKETRDIASKAVARSQQNILNAVGRRINPFDYTRLFQAVWDYVPRPTHRLGIDAVKGAMAHWIDPKNQDVIDRMAALVVDNAQLIVEELVERGELRRN